MKPAVCAECGQEGSLVSGRVIYPRRPDLAQKSFYRCSCGAYCGCHPGTVNPLGTMAGPKTRAARSSAHHHFDLLWQCEIMTRKEAYRWLGQTLGVESERCHIGMLDAAECEVLVEACIAREKTAG